MSLFNLNLEGHGGHQGPENLATTPSSTVQTATEMDQFLSSGQPIPSIEINDSDSENSIYESTLSSLDMEENIILHIGNHVYHTTIRTLSQSCYFLDYFREHSHPNRVYSIDADGDMFQYILTYLRHSQAPLLWDNQNGIDYAAYHRLRTQAAYFEVDKLVEWIDDERYDNVGNQIVSINVHNMPVSGEQLGRRIVSSGESLGKRGRICAVNNVSTQEWSCPRNIPVHKDAKDCGQACYKKKEQGFGGYVNVKCVQVAIEGIRTRIEMSKLKI